MRGRVSNVRKLVELGFDFSGDLDGRGEGLCARSPASRASGTRIFGHVLERFELAEEFGTVASERAGSDFDAADDALRVDDEGSASGDAGIGIENAVGVGDFAGGGP